MGPELFTLIEQWAAAVQLDAERDQSADLRAGGDAVAQDRAECPADIHVQGG